MSSSADALLDAAEEIAALMRLHNVEPIVIGATALAAHRYIRMTRDIDLGCNADLAKLRQLATALQERGYQASLREPDADDPLGGVIDVQGPFGLVQIINFYGRFPAAIEDALREAQWVIRPGSRLALAPIPQLIALKLYAGGRKSKLDILELLDRNPEVDIEAIRARCRAYGLKEIDELLDERRK